MKRYEKELTAEELAALSDEEIDFTDIPELDESFWQNAKPFRSQVGPSTPHPASPPPDQRRSD